MEISLITLVMAIVTLAMSLSPIELDFKNYILEYEAPQDELKLCYSDCATCEQVTTTINNWLEKKCDWDTANSCIRTGQDNDEEWRRIRKINQTHYTCE